VTLQAWEIDCLTKGRRCQIGACRSSALYDNGGLATCARHTGDWDGTRRLPPGDVSTASTLVCYAGSANEATALALSAGYIVRGKPRPYVPTESTVVENWGKARP
jgi:hypothetical protein